MSAADLSIAVVGAGPAGLAAALRLHAAGARVTVVDAAPAVGGRTWTDHAEGGWRIDPGVQLYSSTDEAFLGLLRAAGGESLSERAPGRDALWRKGRAHEVVYGSPASMLASGALPLALKLRMGTHYLPFVTRHGSDLRMGALERAAAAGLDTESIAAWGQRELGRDFVDLLAAPLLGTLYGTRPDEASAGFYHALAHQGLHLHVRGLRGGADGFCRAAADRLRQAGARFHLSTPVDEVATEEEGVRVSAGAGSERFSAAVVALPAPQAGRVAKFLTPEGTQALLAVRVRPAASLALPLDRPAGVRWFGLSFPPGDARNAAAICVQENKVGGLVPPGKGLLVVFAQPHAAQRLLGATADDALALLLPDVTRALPGIDRAVVQTRFYDWRYGWTIFGPGSLGRLPALRSIALDSSPSAVLAGDWLYSPTVEGAVTSGLAAADRLLARLR